jgi:hypothetical protein
MVVVENQTIIIEPVNPRVIYIPYYDPYYVYGTWWWTPGFAPYYWGPPGVDVGVGISFWPGIYFGVSFYRWSYFDWRHHFVHIDLHKRPKFVRHDYWRGTSERWVHVPKHRRGVAYRDKSTARKFGQSSHRPAVFRRDARGFPEQSLIKQSRPEKDRTNINLYRQQQQRIERKRTELEQATNDRKERLRIAPEKHKLQRKESPRPKPARGLNKKINAKGLITFLIGWRMASRNAKRVSAGAIAEKSIKMKTGMSGMTAFVVGESRRIKP